MKSEKITEKTRSRRYDDACGAAHALDLVGDRWALLVIRELFFGPRRFGDLRQSLPGISANVLTQRLEELASRGIVVRRVLPPPASTPVYDLTDWGRESEPIFQTLGRWAARSPSHDPTLAFSASSLLLSLRTMFDGGRAARFEGRIGLRIGRESFVARIANGAIEVGLGDVSGAECVFTGDARTIAAAIYGGQPLAALAASGALGVEGDRALSERFVTWFPLPPKA